MSKGRGLGRLIVAAMGIGCFCAAAAAAPWDKMLTTNRVEADPEKSYVLTERNGPWMIMTCSFSGPNAAQQAHDLVLELRKRYKLPAYAYEKKFDLSKDLPDRIDEMGRPKKMKYARGRTEIDEIAVLVGDYPAVDDPEAQETLRKLKYYQPDCLRLGEGRSTARNLAAWRLFQGSILGSSSETKNRGPMGHAFITTNPLIPSDYFAPKGVDELVLKSNEGVENCLLDCPGKLTVQVATFTGRVVIDQKEINLISKGKDIDSQLVEATLKAHELTKALRIKGYEAYEFHDRYASIVTVGSFDSPGWPKPDGRINLDPRIQAIIDGFGGKLERTAQYPNGTKVPQQIIGITLDPQPRLVHVPKRPASSLIRQENVRVTRLP
jgi:hypothetical protein